MAEGDGTAAVFWADAIHGLLQLFLFLRTRHLLRGKEICLLVGLQLICQVQSGNTDEPNRGAGDPNVGDQLRCGGLQLPHQVGAVGQLLLSGYEDALGLRKKLLEIEAMLDGVTRKAENGGVFAEIINEINEIKDSLF